MVELIQNKLKLHGFNNLTKSLSFNIYDICYAKSEKEQRGYIAYIDEHYDSERLTGIMHQLANMIGATVLSVSKQDYEPQGASCTFLIADVSMRGCFDVKGGTQIGVVPGALTSGAVSSDALASGAAASDTLKAKGLASNALAPDVVLAHLDKSHVTVHTYPEYHPESSIATFRVDIDVSTCGEITPLSTLDYLIKSFDSDIITMDYRVRGFTRDVSGKKIFLDEGLTSIQSYIDQKILEKYDAADVNMYQNNMFHTKMLIKDVDLQNYLFNMDAKELPPKERLAITTSLRQEMIEIYSGVNVFAKD